MRHSFWVSHFTHRPHTNKSCKENCHFGALHMPYSAKKRRVYKKKSNNGFSTGWHMALWVKLWNDNNDAIENKRVGDNQLQSENSSYVIKNFTTIFTAKHFSLVRQSYSLVCQFKVKKKAERFFNFFVFFNIRTHQKAVLFTCCARFQTVGNGAFCVCHSKLDCYLKL